MGEEEVTWEQVAGCWPLAHKFFRYSIKLFQNLVFKANLNQMFYFKWWHVYCNSHRARRPDVGEVEQASEQKTPTKAGQLEPEAKCDHDDRFSMFGLNFIWRYRYIDISNHIIPVSIWRIVQGFVTSHFSTPSMAITSMWKIGNIKTFAGAQRMKEWVKSWLGKNQRKCKLILWIS